MKNKIGAPNVFHWLYKHINKNISIINILVPHVFKLFAPGIQKLYLSS